MNLFPSSFTPSHLVACTSAQWPVYQISLRFYNQDGDQFQYIVESGEPKHKSIDSLPAEFYAEALRKVDITSPESLLSFCAEYGIPTSPFYPGALRLALFRSRNIYGYKKDFGWKSPSYFDNRPSMLADSYGPTPEQSLMRLDPLTSSPMDWQKPEWESEAARAKEASDGDVVGAVSLLEVAQTVRIMQSATVLPVVVRYACENGWSADDIRSYLANKRYFAQKGAELFIFSDSELYSGPGIDTYNDLLLSDDKFAELMEEGEAAGYDVRSIYDASAASQYYDRGVDCIDFLDCVASHYYGQWQAYENIIKKLNSLKHTPLGVLFSKVSPIGNSPRSNPESTNSNVFGSLTVGIIEGFFSVFDDPLPYRRCGNCGRIFKFYKDGGHVRRCTEFCSKSCNVSFNIKKRRRAE